MTDGNSTEQKRKIVIGMPAYNEEKYIGSLVLGVGKYADTVLVVDDGSADRTAALAERGGAHVVRHGQNRGYGATIQSIMAEAKSLGAEVLVILDADSQHNPDEIPSLVEAIRAGADVVIGSREHQKQHIAAYRRFGQRVLTRMTQIASREKLTDTESGFRAYSRRALETLELKETGMAISSEIVSEAVSKGLTVTEVPISVTYTADSSTLNPVRHGVGVLNRIMAMISERRPLLFFGLFGGFFSALGLAAAIIVIRLYYFSPNVFAIGTALLSILFTTIGLLTIFTGIILNVLVKRLNTRL